MIYPINERIIRSLCGLTSFNKGASYVRSGKVTLTSSNPNESVVYARVDAEESYDVAVRFDHNGEVAAECSCSSFFSFDKHCKHTAAALLCILYSQRDEEAEHHSITGVHKVLRQAEEGNNNIDQRLTNSMLELFEDRRRRPSHVQAYFDTRTVLEAELICRVFSYGIRSYRFGFEMKVGPKRTYIVQNIRSFLDRVKRKESYAFSKNFTYDPELHCFKKEHDEIIRKFIELYDNEYLTGEIAGSSSGMISSRPGGERALLIPPYVWGDLYPLLAAAPSVKLEVGGVTYDGLELSDGIIPLQFEFKQSVEGAKGYKLDVHGMEQLIVMDAYELVVAEGKLWSVSAEQCNRLAEMKYMLEDSGRNSVGIAAQQIEPFMEKVIPGLRKLGRVVISKGISNQIVQTPLSARLYLDRVRDRLLAGLEFQYGDIIVNPLQEAQQSRAEGQILIRNGDQENRILELMEQGRFIMTEGGYFMDDEDDEYHFLYHIVPLLEPLLKVYATSAVKVRLVTGNAPPSVTVNIDERTDWLKIHFDMDGIPESEVRKVLQSLEEKRRYHKLPDGALMPLESSEFQAIVRFMNDIGMNHRNLVGSHAQLPAVRGLRLIDSDRQGSTIRLERSLRKLLEHLRNPDHLDFPVPESLSGILRDYQGYGYQWMKTLALYRFGGVLADEMGLGKTIQAISFIISVLPEIREQRQPVLVVAPASLMYNWLNEFSKFAPEVQAVVADGSKAERVTTLRKAEEVDVVITSYPLLRRDLEEVASLSFHTLILDEAQTFKNHATQTAQAVKAINSIHRFALTGTPVENRMEELWSIFNTVFPELFPGRQEFNDLSKETVAKRIRPFLLRRLKRDVLKELPEKIETLQASELLPEQKKLYAAYLAKLQHETLKHLNEKGFQKNRIKILAGITRLRQICCHPALFVEGYEGSSAKFKQLMEIVEDCRNAGRRVLIFSQFTEMLGLIGRELGDQGVPYFYLDGKTRAEERVSLCDRFNAGERDLFLVSLKAGGTGLNLAGADTVILYDLWWNPAVEQQATDRAHRIGQKKIVQIIRLVSRGTVENKMYELQQKKKDLIEDIIGPGEEAQSALTEQDIREILMI
ncbi:DEAD/DEAH box helicase [Paenibacillus dakarensis]|uniref:DEAD/DEAH box helicase n=1 Tax=Paenibacillus dakarensis TaxID=1527293 RepID=UPI0006D5A98C|nr:DEAD/DEAH box helicase [Paenibacillus dakarensis]